MPVADKDTWGAKFEAADGDRLVIDRQLIVDLGFTIVAEDLLAGRTKIFAWGPGSSVNAYRLDTLNLCTLPGLFFLINPGDEITESLIRAWVPRSEITR